MTGAGIRLHGRPGPAQVHPPARPRRHLRLRLVAAHTGRSMQTIALEALDGLRDRSEPRRPCRGLPLPLRDFHIASRLRRYRAVALPLSEDGAAVDHLLCEIDPAQ